MEDIIKKSEDWWNNLGEVDRKLTFQEIIYCSPLKDRKSPTQKHIVAMYKLHHNITLEENDYPLTC